MSRSSHFRDPLDPAHAHIVADYVSSAIEKDVLGIAERPEVAAGGVENRNYRITVDLGEEKQTCILRCPPEEIPDWRKGDYDLGREYCILNALEPFDIRTPRVWGYDPEGRFFGVPCFLMEYLPGTSLFHSLFPSCGAQLISEYAQCVARIVRLPYQESGWLRKHLPKWTLERKVNWMAWRARKHPGDPLVEFALSWLKERMPRPGPLTFSHGDVNPSNFLVVDGKIDSVVDWEFASLKDHPLGEVSFFCWLYDGELARRGFTREFCRAMGRQPDELEWFFILAWFGVTFASGDTVRERFAGNRRHLARGVGYAGES